MVYHRSLSDSKCPQVSRIFLSILSDLNNAIVWMVSAHPLISESSRPFINSSVTAPITFDIAVAFMINFFISLVRSRYLSFFSFSFGFTRSGKVHYLAGFLSFVVYHYHESVCISKNVASHFPWRILSFAYTICSYGQILASYTIPSGSFGTPTCVYSYTLCVLAYCIRFLCNESIFLYHHITYFYYFVVFWPMFALT